MNLLSGTAKLREKKYPIVWTGQNAQHLAERYMDEHTLHPFLHVKVQQMAASGTWIKGKGKGRAYSTEFSDGGSLYKIVGVLHSHFMELKTCYKDG